MAHELELGGLDLTSAGSAQGQVGYRLLASRIASDRDNEPFVFRKFDHLGALNLLYLQSEVYDIERQFRQIELEEAAKEDMDATAAARNWEELKRQSSLLVELNSCSTNSGAAPEFIERSKKKLLLISDLRVKIKEYHEAMLLQSQIAQLLRPQKRVLNAMGQMFNHGGAPIIGGQAGDYLQAYDLVALKSPAQDPLSNYLRRSRFTKMKDEESADGSNIVGRFNENEIIRYVNFVTILVAIIFIAGPVLALYFSNSAPARLSIVMIFTRGFAGSVSLITNARRAEIFVGTATYAAVLVVFISSGDLSGDNLQTVSK